MAKDNEIKISLDENPTTGFMWSYEVVPEGIIELVSDRYKLDQEDDSMPPVCGGGGTHFWMFKVIGSGVVEIKFTLHREDEKLGDDLVFRYTCDGDKVISE